MSDYHEGLLHISEVSPLRTPTLTGVLDIGETLTVAVSKIDNGKIGLSIKNIDPDFIANREKRATSSIATTPPVN